MNPTEGTNRIIIHILEAHRVNLDPYIALSFYKSIKCPQIFIFCEYCDYDSTIYEEIKSQHPEISFHFTKPSISKIESIVSDYKNPTIFFQCVRYKLMSYFAFNSKYNDVRWNCWGAGARIGNNIRSRMFAPIKRTILKRFTKINSLMQPDADDLASDFGVTSTVIPLIGNSETLFPFDREHVLTPLKNDKLVFLGNSHHCITEYLDVLDTLSHLKGEIEITCMCNYSFDENKLYYELQNSGKNLFGAKFFIDRNMYRRLDYYKFMNSPSVYICHREYGQTGGGAAHTSLRLGKKVYLNGVNYNWFKSLGYIIHHTNELEGISVERLLERDSEEVRLHNYDTFSKFNQTDKIIAMWKEWLN